MSNTGLRQCCVGSLSTFESKPTLALYSSSQPRAMEHIVTMGNLQRPGISAFPSWRATAERVVPGQGVPVPQNQTRNDRTYPQTAYISGEGLQSCPQMTDIVDPVVWNQQSHDTLLIPGLAYEPIQGTDFYGGQPRGQYMAQYDAMKGLTPSWPCTTFDNMARCNMSAALSVADTELSSSSPESLLSDISDHDKSFRAEGYHSPDISWGGSDATSYASLEHSPSYGEPTNLVPYNLNQLKLRSTCVGMTGLPYAISGQETPFLDPNQGYETYTIHQQPSLSAAWSASGWAYTDNLGARDRFQWGSAQETTYPPLLGSGDINEQQDMFACDPGDIATVDLPSPEHRFVSNDSSGQVTIRGDDRPEKSQSPPTTKAQRKKEDQILLEGKRAGLTYKEIKKHMHSKVAESTLRGRYRSLTKARKDRVRKPVWNANDVRLLKEVVHAELTKLDESCCKYSSEELRWAKLSWKRIAAYIADRGGSYHFGNSTCKKKWAEISASC